MPNPFAVSTPMHTQFHQTPTQKQNDAGCISQKVSNKIRKTQKNQEMEGMLCLFEQVPVEEKDIAVIRT